MNKNADMQNNSFQDGTGEFAQEEMPEENEEDRVIFNMNVEGMPGYRPELSRKSTDRGEETLSKRETRQFMLTATLTGLLVAAVFSAVLILFTLFCTQIWFK